MSNSTDEVVDHITKHGADGLSEVVAKGQSADAQYAPPKAIPDLKEFSDCEYASAAAKGEATPAPEGPPQKGPKPGPVAR